MKKAITYYRVSRKRQGISGLGLAAQKVAVREFARKNGFRLTSEFVEIESTRKRRRPVLLQALEACRDQQATLLIAKLDRLARSVAFISALMEAKVDFTAVDNPHAGKLLVHIMAAFAEHERDQISERTVAALKMAKAKGIELGKHGRYVQSVANRKAADRFAKKLLPVILRLRSRGINTVRAIADELNRLKVPTYSKNGKWHVSTVHNLMKRLGRERK